MSEQRVIVTRILAQRLRSHKVCVGCLRILPVGQFSKDRDGLLSSSCDRCHSPHAREEPVTKPVRRQGFIYQHGMSRPQCGRGGEEERKRT